MIELKHVTKRYGAKCAVDDISFTINKGEVLGFSGLVGAGRTETMRAVFGADKPEAGMVTLNGKQRLFKDPKQAVRSRLGLLPEDRKQQGVVLDQSIRINTTLSCLKKVERFPG